MSELITKTNGTTGLSFENHVANVVKDIMHSTLQVNLSCENASVVMEKNYPNFVTGLMVLQGKRDIILTLSFSKMAAAKVVVSLLGIKYNELIEEVVYDAVMEITNMISGRMKSALLSTSEQYQLTTPLVFVGANHFLAPKARPKGIVKKLNDKHFEILCSVFFL